jgi:hypothetical protein
MNCQIEFANDDVGMPCGKPALAKCGDCGSSICDVSENDSAATLQTFNKLRSSGSSVN